MVPFIFGSRLRPACPRRLDCIHPLAYNLLAWGHSHGPELGLSLSLVWLSVASSDNGLGNFPAFPVVTPVGLDGDRVFHNTPDTLSARDLFTSRISGYRYYRNDGWGPRWPYVANDRLYFFNYRLFSSASFS